MQSLLTTVALLLPSTFAAGQDDPVREIVAAVSAERILADVATLVGFHTRNTFSETESDERGIGAARRWLAAELGRISEATGGNLEVLEQRFLADVRGREVEIVNVYGFLPGSIGDPFGPTYVVSGHYDSIASDPFDTESRAPGADDDASGTAVVLELARVLAGHELRANLVFLCVAGEEQGLYGSRHFAARAEEDGVRIEGMLTNDIVGGIEGGNGLVDELTLRCFSAAEGLNSPSRELARSVAEAARRWVPGFDVKLVFRLDRFGRGGDHRPFHERGWPAVRLTEANEFYARQHQNVRVEDGIAYGDVLEHVSAAYMANVARVNAALLAEQALAPAPPAPPSMRAAMRYDTRLSWEPVEGAASYEVVWRDTTAPEWEGAETVGPGMRTLETRAGLAERVVHVVERRSADTFFFGVRSVSAAGHRSRVVLPERP